MGKDKKGGLVFSVGMETAAVDVIKGLRNLISIASIDIGMVKFVDTMPCVNIWMKIGGVTSRAFGLKGLGRPLVLFGTRLAFMDIAKLVKNVREGGE